MLQLIKNGHISIFAKNDQKLTKIDFRSKSSTTGITSRVYRDEIRQKLVGGLVNTPNLPTNTNKLATGKETYAE